MAEFVLAVLAQAELVAGEAEVGVPREPAVAPVLVPLTRRLRMAEELDLHLLELARAEGELLRRDLVAEALAHLRDAKWDLHARRIHDILEVDEDPLRRFGTEKSRALLAAERPNIGLEHQVEL